MFLQPTLPWPSLSLCSSQRGLWMMIWYKQGISFLPECSLPICSVLTAQPPTKPYHNSASFTLHRSLRYFYLQKLERDDQQARLLPGSVWILKSQKRVWRQQVLFCTALLLCTAGLSQISITHCAKAPGAGRKGSWHCSPFFVPTHRECNIHMPILGSSLLVNAAFEIFQLHIRAPAELQCYC